MSRHAQGEESVGQNRVEDRVIEPQGRPRIQLGKVQTNLEGKARAGHVSIVIESGFPGDIAVLSETNELAQLSFVVEVEPFTQPPLVVPEVETHTACGLRERAGKEGLFTGSGRTEQ